MGRLFETATDLDADREVLINRPYGLIEVCDQELAGVHLRPFPNLVSIVEVYWSNFWKSRSRTSNRADRVLLYYNQPMLHRNFLSLSYFVSDNKSTLASIAVSLSVLDFIAKLKKTDAVVTEITNNRIKDRHLEHFGWESHRPSSRKRHWIKRFYGEYPDSFLFQAGINPKPANSRPANSVSAIPIPKIRTVLESSVSVACHE